MPNNSPIRKYFAVEKLVTYILTGVGGIWGRVLAFLLVPLFNWLASKGVYFIDVATVNIRTNMDKDTWERVAGDVWEKVDAGGLSEQEGKELDAKFIKAFNNFTIFKRVKRK